MMGSLVGVGRERSNKIRPSVTLKIHFLFIPEGFRRFCLSS